MGSAKNIKVILIANNLADEIVKKYHYSKKVTNSVKLNFGIIYDGKLLGAMQFGCPMDKSKVLNLVRDTKWGSMLELNRMAFSDELPRFSESRALSVAFKIIKKQYPHIEWILSFSDATQCGDGAIYRASGFVLTQIKKNTGVFEMPDGTKMTTIGIKMAHKWRRETFGVEVYGAEAMRVAREHGLKRLAGFQLRYIKFLNPSAIERLTVPILPFSAIEESGAGMYRGTKKSGGAVGSV